MTTPSPTVARLRWLRSAVPQWVPWPLCFVALVVVLSLASQHLTLTSDQASLALEARNALHGNGILTGWHVPSDSFALTEVPVYALALALSGFGPEVFRLVPALQYAVLVMLLARLAGGRGRQAAVAVILTILVAGLPSWTPPFAALNGLITEHISTLIGCCLAVLLARFAFEPGGGRLGPGWWQRGAAAVAVLVLAVAIYDDPFAVFLVVLPTLAITALQLWRGQQVREHLTRAGGTVAASALAAGLGGALHLLGGAGVTAPLVHFNELGQLPATAGRMVTYFFQVTGGDFWGSSLRSLQTWAALAHAAVALTLLGAVGMTVVGWLRGRPTDQTELLLSMGCLVTAAALLFSQALTTDSQRYVLVTMLFTIPVAARRVARWSVTCRHPTATPRMLVPGLVVAYVVGFVPALGPPAVPATVSLARFLVQHHLREGIAAYGDAPIVTLQSDAAVQVLPVWQTPSTGSIVPQTYLSNIAWFQPQDAASHAQRSFALWSTAAPADGLDASTTAAEFGTPVQQYRVAGFTVAVWNRPIVATVYANYLSAERVTEGKLPSLPSP